MKEFDVWMEGYSVTGNHAKAEKVGTVEAPTFADACEALLTKPPHEAKHFDKTSLTYWGCRLFDNEADARKAFG